MDQPDYGRPKDIGNESRHTNVRGRIALIRKGSKQVVGVADLIETLPRLSASELRETVNYHCVPEGKIDEERKHSIPWVLHDARPLGEPVTYRHPAGAVIWVNLDAPTIAAIDKRSKIDNPGKANGV